MTTPPAAAMMGRVATLGSDRAPSCISRRISRPTTRKKTLMSPSLTRSEEHTSELQSPCNLVCRLLLEKKNTALLVIPYRRRNHQLFLAVVGGPHACGRSRLRVLCRPLRSLDLELLLREGLRSAPDGHP